MIFVDTRPDIARTNMMLAELRRVLDGACEAYVKWWYGGAFNGGAYVGEDGKPAFDVAFWHSGAAHAAYRPAFCCEIDGIVIHVDGRPTAALDLLSILTRASRLFDSQLGERGPKLLSQVRRIAVCAYFRDDIVYEAGGAVAETFADRLGRALGGAARVAGRPSPMPSGAGFSFIVDVEVVFREPLERADVLGRCREMWPGLDGHLFGYGIDWSSKCVLPEISFSHIVARQF